MPSFNFIPPLSGAGASKKSLPADDADEAQPAEKFQSVMVRILSAECGMRNAEQFSESADSAKTPRSAIRAPQSNASSDDCSRSQNEAAAGFSNGGEDGQPAHKILLLPQADESSASGLQRKMIVDTGKTGAKKADTVRPVREQSGTITLESGARLSHGVNPALSTLRSAATEDGASTVLTMAANVLPMAAGPAPATVLVIAGGTNAEVSTKPVAMSAECGMRNAEQFPGRADFAALRNHWRPRQKPPICRRPRELAGSILPQWRRMPCRPEI